MIHGAVWTIISHPNEGNRTEWENGSVTGSDGAVCVIPAGSGC